MPGEPKSGYSGFGMAMGLSAELVATTGVGLGLGWVADRLLHTSPIFLFIGALLGGAAGVVRLYRQWQRLTR
ncbi:MAG: AtpZ/AtpI family protein [Actinomycetota bacterium]